MLRKVGIDAAGAIHPMIIRGIERKKIFQNDSDRENIIEWGLVQTEPAQTEEAFRAASRFSEK